MNLVNNNVTLCNKVNNEIIEASKNSYIIENLQNPDSVKVKEVQSIVGSTITFELGKVGNNIYKMVSPSHLNLREVANRLCDCITILKKSGKSDNAINNIYYRFLCWMHFEFCEVLRGNTSKNVQYWGTLDTVKLMMLYITSGAEISILAITNFVNTAQELKVSVLNLDSGSDVTDKTKFSDYKMDKNPIKLNINNLVRPVSKPKPKYSLGTNMWLKGDVLDEIFIPYEERIVNLQYATKSAFIKVNGVADRTTYTRELYDMYNNHKSLVQIVNNDFNKPTPNDITRLRIKTTDMIQYSCNLCDKLGLEKDVKDVLASELIKIVDKENKLLDIFFVIESLVKGHKFKDRQYLFFLQTKELTQLQLDILYLLSCIMFDVVIFNPSNIEFNGNKYNLYEMNFTNTLDLKEYPVNEQALVVETTAYNAENQLTDMLYDGSAGIYRDNQFNDARVAYLKPMNEEIDILWDKAVNLRQGFGVTNGVVTIPAIFAEILGVKNEDKEEFINRLNRLMSNNVIYNDNHNMFVSLKDIYSAEVMSGRVIVPDRLKNHQNYGYRHLDNTKQDYMIRKLQDLLDSGIIDGVYTHGVENEVLSVFLSLCGNDRFCRLIQNFDFTKENPKVIYVWMSMEKIPRPDIIALHYLNLLGFDVLLFVPTGFNVVDEYITREVFTQYRDGNGIEPFSFNLSSKKKQQSFFEKIFRR